MELLEITVFGVAQGLGPEFLADQQQPTPYLGAVALHELTPANEAQVNDFAAGTDEELSAQDEADIADFAVALDNEFFGTAQESAAAERVQETWLEHRAEVLRAEGRDDLAIIAANVVITYVANRIIEQALLTEIEEEKRKPSTKKKLALAA